jgi:hypothetical protein
MGLAGIAERLYPPTPMLLATGNREPGTVFMAEEHKKKHKPRTIITHRHDDNTFHHEHMHDDGKHSMFAGTSADVADVQQHMADHFGGGAEAEAEPAEAAAAPAEAGAMPGA